jgi:membrane dipeptidase
MDGKIQERIKNIHKNFTIVDAHFDLLIDVENKRRRGQEKVIEAEYLPEFKEGGVNTIVSSIYIEDHYLPEMALRKALDQISAFYSELDESGDKIMFLKNCFDAERALREGKIGIFLSFEGVEPLINDINLLRIFYELGVRGVGLTWSRRNYAADGCSFTRMKDRENGLTEFGEQVVKQAEELGMVIDVSHLNETGFWDVMEIATKPVIASHSNCRAINGIMRNLTDDQIKALAKTGGIIGINAASILVAEKNADVKVLADHVDYLKKVAGIEHVGLGFDFCDKIFRDQTKDTDKKQDSPYDVIKGHQNIHLLTKELIMRGYDDDELKLIYGENFMRVYKSIFK